MSNVEGIEVHDREPLIVCMVDVEKPPVLGENDRRGPVDEYLVLIRRFAVFDTPVATDDIRQLPSPLEPQGVSIQQRHLRRTRLRDAQKRPFSSAIHHQFSAVPGVLQQ